MRFPESSADPLRHHDRWRGALTLAASVGSAALVSDGPDDLRHASAVAFVGAWGFGVLDGAHAARRHNVRLGPRVRLGVGPSMGGARAGAWVGLRIKGDVGR